jgi:hypothetical protein
MSEETSPTLFVAQKINLKGEAWDKLKFDFPEEDRRGDLELWSHPSPARILDTLRPWPDAWYAFLRAFVVVAKRIETKEEDIREFVLVERRDADEARIRQLEAALEELANFTVPCLEVNAILEKAGVGKQWASGGKLPGEKP